MDCLIKQNVNPIAKLERTGIILAKGLFNLPPDRFIDYIALQELQKTHENIFSC